MSIKQPTKKKQSKLMALLRKYNACVDAVELVKTHKTPAAAWGACSNPEWLLWAINALEIGDDKRYRLFACWCCRQVWHLLTDERSRVAVEIAERFASMEATEDELAAAREAAWAAWAAASESRAAWAAWAAWSAASDSRVASAAEYAGLAAASKADQCNNLRKMFGRQFRKVIVSM